MCISLLMREAALQKRRKVAEEILQWHQRLLEEERKISELELAASSIIDQASQGDGFETTARQKFKGSQLNQLWLSMTGRQEKKFKDEEIYNMSRISLEKFCRNAKHYDKVHRRNHTLDGQQAYIPDNQSGEYLSDFESADSSLVNGKGGESSDSGEFKAVTEISQLKSGIIGNHDKSTSEEELQSNTIKTKTAISSNEKIQTNKSFLPLISTKIFTDSALETCKSDNAHTISDEESIKDIESSVHLQSEIEKNTERDNTIKTETTVSTNEDIEGSKSRSPLILTKIPTGSALETSMSDDVHMTSDESIKDVQSDGSSPRLNSRTEKNNTINTESPMSTSDNIQASESGSHLIPTKIPTGSPLEMSKSDNAHTTSDEESIKDVQSDSSSTHLPFGTEKYAERDSVTDQIEDESLSQLKPDSQNENADGSTNTIGSRGDQKIPHSETLSELNENMSLTNGPLSKTLSSKINTERGTDITASEHISNSVNLKSLTRSISSNINTERGTTTLLSFNPNIISKIENDFKLPITKLSGDAIKICDLNEIVSETLLKCLDVKVTFGEDARNDSQNPKADNFSTSNLNENVSPSRTIDSISEIEEDPVFYSNEYMATITNGSAELSELEINDKSKQASPILTNSTRGKVVKDETETSKSESVDISEENSELSSSHSSVKPTIHLLSDYGYIAGKTGSVDSIASTAGPSSIDTTPEEILENILSPVKNESGVCHEALEKKESDTSIPTLTISLHEDASSNVDDSSMEKLENVRNEEYKSTLESGEDQTSSEQSISEKVPDEKRIDVKKRVLEILSDANISSPRGDRSPRMQDFYVTAYDVTSPSNSPNSASPTDDVQSSYVTQTVTDEVEELLKKQIAIEREIKEIQQQQKEHLPYLYVREIPNKPPPPYTPPAITQKTNIKDGILPIDESQINVISKATSEILHKAFKENNLYNITLSENAKKILDLKSNVGANCYQFLFDLSKEMAIEHYKQFEPETGPSWMHLQKQTKLAIGKPLDQCGLDKLINKKIKQVLGYEIVRPIENKKHKWSSKKRDHVDELLVVECQREEAEWTNYDRDELIVKDELTKEIFDMLLSETGQVLSNVLKKKNLS